MQSIRSRRKTNKDYPLPAKENALLSAFQDPSIQEIASMSSKVNESKERGDDETPESTENGSEVVMVEICRVSDTKGGFGPFPDPGIGGTFNRA
jgi:hypothetical protein